MSKRPHRILLLESIHPTAYARLADYCEVVQCPGPEPRKINGIITRGKGVVDAALLNTLAPDLRLVARCGVGLDNIDVATASQNGVAVLNAPGSNAATVAEHTLALMLTLRRELVGSFAAVRNGDWGYRKNYGGNELRGQKIAILGMGDIGSRVARLATAFGMRVAYWDRSEKDVPYPFEPWDTLLADVDVVSLHLPLTESTSGLVNAAFLTRVPAQTILINTARGELIDQQALLAALQEQRLAGFAADVLATEPPDPDDPLLALPNVHVTPHAASLTETTYREMCLLSVDNVIRYLRDEAVEPRYIFNREQL